MLNGQQGIFKASSFTLLVYLMPLFAQSFNKFSSVFKHFNVYRRLLPCSLTPQFVLFTPTYSSPQLWHSVNISRLCIISFFTDDKIMPNVLQPPLNVNFFISLPDTTVSDLYRSSSTLCLFHLTSLEHFGMAIKNRKSINPLLLTVWREAIKMVHIVCHYSYECLVLNVR